MEVISFCFPAFAYCFLFYYANKGKVSKIEIIIRYVFSFAIINVIISSIWMIIKKKNQNVILVLQKYGDFALKYLFLGIIIAIILVFLERYLKNKIKIDITYPTKIQIKLFMRIISVLIFVVCSFFVLHNLARCFNNCFWGDEGITILNTRRNFPELLKNVAQNGHSPFQYVFEWLFCKILGCSGFTYHFASTLPYFIIIFISFTYIKNKYGEIVSLLTILFSTLLTCAITYNLEVRMYAWCQLFIFISYLVCGELLRNKVNNIYKYILLVVASLGAIYSHYFALFSIAIIFLGLLINAILNNKKEIINVIISGILVILLFLPWLVFAKNVKGVIVSQYSSIVGIPSFKDCFDFIFKSNHSMLFLLIFMFIILLYVLYESNILKYKINNGKTEFSIGVNRFKITLDYEILWVAIGICSTFGTIVASQFISYMFFPITVLRYLYPSFILCWFLFGYCLSRLKFSKVYMLIIAIFLVYTSYPNLLRTTKNEYEQNKRLEKTLDKVYPFINDTTNIYTNISHFYWTVGHVYYPNTKIQLFGHMKYYYKDDELYIPTLDVKSKNLLFLQSPIDDENIDILNEQKFENKLIVDKGYIGTGNVWVYELIYNEFLDVSNDEKSNEK